MGQNSKIEWTTHTGNLWWGCTHVHDGCDNCLSPDTLVLKSDFNWVRIDSLKKGDKLISFNEKGKSLRRYEIATVEKVWNTRSEAIEITTENSRIIASLNHRFLSGKSRNGWPRADQLSIDKALRFVPILNELKESESYQKGYIAGATLGDGTMRFKKGWEHKEHREVKQRYWRIAVHSSQTEFLERVSKYILNLTGSLIQTKPFDGGTGTTKDMIKVETRKTELLLKIRHIIKPSLDSNEFKRGWLAGMFDAEGTYVRYKKSDGSIRVGALRIAQVDRDVLRLGIKYANDLGFNFILEDTRHCATMRIVGGAKASTAFLATIKPALSYKTNPIFGSFIENKIDKIISLKRVGVQDLVDIQTSTGTFIANGLLTHNCYAEAWSKRFDGGNTVWGNDAPRREIRKTFADFKRYQRMAAEAGEIHRVFVGSMMDIFEKPMDLINAKGEPVTAIGSDGLEFELKTDWLRNAFFNDVVPNCPNLMFLLLTKRPSNINKYIPNDWKKNPPENVMFGTSIVNQKTADDLIPQLLRVNGKRFLSMEPQLGKIMLGDFLWMPEAYCEDCGTGGTYLKTPCDNSPCCFKPIDWVIQGGESGPHKRPFNTDWARLIRDECKEARVPYFFKQIDKVQDIPEDLMIKEFPEYHTITKQI
jgi:protein gp37